MAARTGSNTCLSTPLSHRNTTIRSLGSFLPTRNPATPASITSADPTGRPLKNTPPSPSIDTDTFWFSSWASSAADGGAMLRVSSLAKLLVRRKKIVRRKAMSPMLASGTSSGTRRVLWIFMAARPSGQSSSTIATTPPAALMVASVS